jgi:Diacylglycerol acyltransferase
MTIRPHQHTRNVARMVMTRRDPPGPEQQQISNIIMKTSIYPLNPTGSKVLLRVSEKEFTSYDRFVVVCSSLFFVGGVFWVPALYLWLLKRYRSIPRDETRRRAACGSLLLALAALYAVGPHRNARVGDWVQVRKWSLWKSWLRFFAFEVVADDYDSIKDLLHDQAILGISPHGVFPFGLAFAALSEQSAQVFGSFRAVVASATQLMPWVRDVLRWVRAV